jgi:hypothetical protein
LFKRFLDQQRSISNVVSAFICTLVNPVHLSRFLAVLLSLGTALTDAFQRQAWDSRSTAEMFLHASVASFSEDTKKLFGFYVFTFLQKLSDRIGNVSRVRCFLLHDTLILQRYPDVYRLTERLSLCSYSRQCTTCSCWLMWTGGLSPLGAHPILFTKPRSHRYAFPLACYGDVFIAWYPQVSNKRQKFVDRLRAAQNVPLAVMDSVVTDGQGRAGLQIDKCRHEVLQALGKVRSPWKAPFGLKLPLVVRVHAK